MNLERKKDDAEDLFCCVLIIIKVVADLIMVCCSSYNQKENYSNPFQSHPKLSNLELLI